MFDGLTSETRGGARRASALGVSLAVHGGVVSIALVTSYVRTQLPEPGAISVVLGPGPHPAMPPPPPPRAGSGEPHPTLRTARAPATPRQRDTRAQAHPLVNPRPVAPAVVEPEPQHEAPAEPAIDSPAAASQSVETPAPSSGDASSATPGVAGGDAAGVRGGEPGGVVGGVVGGAIGSTSSPSAGQAAAPLLLGGSMTRPFPTSDCRPPAPQAPEQARLMGLSGMVLVEYVVYADGHVDHVQLKNADAHPLLFEATRTWLLGCRFTPSMSAGRPLDVRMITPFHFKSQR